MFITNNSPLFHLWQKENLAKHQKVSKYYDHDSRHKPDFRKQFFASLDQKAIRLSGVKTIRHQSFTICSPVYLRKHPMITVKTSHIKIAVDISQSLLSLIIKTISHTSSLTSNTKIFKKILKNSKPHTHYFINYRFIPNYSPNKLTKKLFDGNLLIN